MTIELTTAFTKDQIQWLRDKFISLELWFSSDEKASRKLKEKMAGLVKEISENVEVTEN